MSSSSARNSKVLDPSDGAWIDAYLTSADAEVFDLIDASILSLEEKARTLKTYRNSRLPISRLPPEALAEVFLVLHDILAGTDPCEIKKTAYRWLCVSHVCQRWREVALNCPELWSCLQFGAGTSSRLQELQLERSKAYPLEVRASLEDTSDSTFLASVLANASRLRTVAVHSRNRSRGSALEKLGANEPATRLETIILQELAYSATQGLELPPHLKTFRVHRCWNEESWNATMFNGRALTELEIIGTGPRTWADLSQILQALSTNLKTLRIHGALPSLPADAEDHGGLHLPQPAHLAKLEDLFLEDTTPEVYHLLGRTIRIPPSTSLAIQERTRSDRWRSHRDSAQRFETVETQFKELFRSISICRSSDLDVHTICIRCYNNENPTLSLVGESHTDSPGERHEHTSTSTFNIHFRDFEERHRPHSFAERVLFSPKPVAHLPLVLLDNGSEVPGLSFSSLHRLDLSDQDLPNSFWRLASRLEQLASLTVWGLSALSEFLKDDNDALEWMAVDGVAHEVGTRSTGSQLRGDTPGQRCFPALQELVIPAKTLQDPQLDVLLKNLWLRKVASSHPLRLVILAHPDRPVPSETMSKLLEYADVKLSYDGR